jgi:hypothetical protein
LQRPFIEAVNFNMGENDIDDFIMNEEFKQKNNKT